MSTDPATNTQYYNCLYTEEVEWRPKLDGLEFSMIFAEDVAWLNKPFDEEEVARVVKGFNGDKALGPDGFPMAFFQICWDIVHLDIMVVLHDFHDLASFEKSLNATFTTLIPKKVAALDVRDFRSISLMGGVYKILLKVLANRLRLVMHKIISSS